MDEVKKNKKEKKENPTASSLTSLCEPEQRNRNKQLWTIRREKGKTLTHSSQIRALEEKATWNSIER